MFLQIAASMIGVMAFAVLFGTPWRLCIYCGITGAVAWAVYLIVHDAGISMVGATVVAAMLMTIVGRVFSALNQVPATIFVVTGIFPLVPGAGLYYTAYYIMLNDISMASMKGIETFKLALSIAIGLSMGAVIPQKWFNTLREKIEKMKVRSSKVKEQ